MGVPCKKYPSAKPSTEVKKACAASVNRAAARRIGYPQGCTSAALEGSPNHCQQCIMPRHWLHQGGCAVCGVILKASVWDRHLLHERMLSRARADYDFGHNRPKND